MSYSLAGLLAIAIHLIINSNILFNNRWTLLQEERNYRLFLFAVVAYHATDALWGVLYERKLHIPVFIDTEIYFVAMAVAVLLWTRFALSYLRRKNVFSVLLQHAGRLFCAFQLIGVSINVFAPVFFYFDEHHEYHSLILRNVSLVSQVVLFLATSLYTLREAVRTQGREKSRYRTIGLFGLSMSGAIAVQFYYPLLPMYSIGYLLGCCVLHTFVLEDAKAEYRVLHDRLTGLPNSAFLFEKIPELVQEARKGGCSVGLLFIGLNNFKSVNNCYGYGQGDAILRRSAQRLKDLAQTRYIARSGADRFQVILIAKNREAIALQANDILTVMCVPYAVQDGALHVGASAGLAFLDADSDDWNSLFNRAELAMFDAKKHGGNALSLYDESMRTSALDKNRLETALREAVENNALTVYYQPKVDVSKNDVVGCEALVRWQTSDGKWISPAVFIPIAEEAGLVTSIDMLVLRTACRQVLEWRRGDFGDVPVAVNMSVRSILAADFADRVIRILNEEGAPPSLIDIEITESCFMSDMDTAFNAVSRLHEAGMRVALDDFGTGYSSLSYLSAMPLSTLKIDKSFVDGIFSGKVTARPLVKSIISLADSLGLSTVAEGVEDRRQLDFLAGNGANVIQGYLFSKPLCAEACGEFLRDRKARIAAVMQAA